MSKQMEEQELHSFPCTKTEEIKRIDKAVTEVTHAIKGNGRSGLQTEVALIKDSVARIEANVKDLTVKLSSRIEIETELEIDRRVNVELEKRLENRREVSVKKALTIKEFILAAFIILNITLMVYTFFYPREAKPKEITTSAKTN